MRRRTYLTASLAAAVGLAGCEGVLDETDQTGQSDEQTPEDDGDPRLELAEEFVFAALAGDDDTATTLLHPDSPLRDIDFENQELDDASIEESEVVDESGDTATVRLAVQFVVDGNERDNELGLELRRSNRVWTVWDTVQLADDGPEYVPQVSFEITHNSDDGTLTITHEAGDTVVASNLFVYGDGLARTGSWEELGGSASGQSGGEPAVTAGDRVTVGAASEYSVQVLWESGQDSATLASESGSVGEETAGLRIGALVNLSGPVAGYGPQVTNGLFSGLAYKAGTAPPAWDGPGEYELTVGEWPVRVLVRDIEADPSRARAAARSLVTDEDVDVLVGGGTGATAMAVRELAEQSRVPFVVCPATTADLTGGSCSEFVFRTTATSAMTARASAQYVVEETGLEQVALVGNDYAWGREWVSNCRETLTAGNVDVVSEEFVRLGNNSWDRPLEAAESAGADAIISGLVPSAQASFLRAFLAAGSDAQFLSTFWTAAGLDGVESVLEETLGSNFTAQDVREANVGPFVTRYHWNQFDNRVNDWFVNAHTDIYGTVPDTFGGSAFTAGSALVQAIEQQGQSTSEAVVDGLSGMTVEDTPKGPGGYSFQAFNNQARSDVTVAPVVPASRSDWQAAIQPGTPLARVAGSDATLPPSAVDCSLR
ncbi:ABC transporter substrate-binding protein [Salinibaculum rarum]|uniref:ABC transporter substrate-binding protein n=1 Tax=Salinibaculum rarum TaxID=3058903 RepID=UPI0026601E41|nr:ABC transporter substrate-binding protein [Salinibaculum sp. KK48]